VLPSGFLTVAKPSSQASFSTLFIVLCALAGLAVIIAASGTIRWRRYPVLVWLSPLVISGVLALGLVGTAWALRLHWARSDRLALLTYVAAVVALVLAVAAALLAVATYRQSNELPILGIHAQFHPLIANHAVLLAGHETLWVHPGGQKAGSATFRALQASADSSLRFQIVVENSGKVSATHVAVRVSLIGLDQINMAQQGWVPMADSPWVINPVEMGCTAMQWDGGGDVVVHPGFPRHLPMLDLTGVRVLRSYQGPQVFLLDGSGRPVSGIQPHLVLEVVADGVSRPPVHQFVPIDIVETEKQQREKLTPLLQPMLEAQGWRSSPGADPTTKER
jgi:hypothetical protein